MSFGVGFALHVCPICGDLILASGLVFPQGADHLTTTCDKCRSLLEVTRNPTTGKLIIRKAVKH